MAGATEARRVRGGLGGAIPPTSRRATARRPEGKSGKIGVRLVRGSCPRGAARSGLRQVDGMAHNGLLLGD